MIQGIIPNVDAIHQNLSLIHIVQTRNHGHQRCLAAARRSDDTDHLSRLDRQIDLIQHFFCTVFVISEGNILEFDLSVFYNCFRTCCMIVCKTHFCIHHFVNPASARKCPGALQKYHSQHHQGHQHLHNIGCKRRQITDLHLSAQDLIASKPYHNHRCQVHKQHHQRHLCNCDLKCI